MTQRFEFSSHDINMGRRSSIVLIPAKDAGHDMRAQRAHTFSGRLENIRDASPAAPGARAPLMKQQKGLTLILLLLSFCSRCILANPLTHFKVSYNVAI